MRIALNAWFWNRPATGSGQYTRRLALQLADLDPDLCVILVVPSHAGEQDPLQGVDLPPSWVVHQVPVARSAMGKLRFEQFAFPRACSRVGADVGHVPYWAPPALSPVPLVVTIHDVIPLVLRDPSGRHLGGPLQRMYTALVSATARGATLVITDSEASRQDILSRLGLRPQRVRSIPLAADDRFGPESAPNDAAVRAAYGLPDRYVLYLGGFDWRKNLITVLAAYGRAAPTIGDDCPLVIAGRLPVRDKRCTVDPRRLREEARVPKRFVHFSGFVDEADKPAVYRGAVALIFPSLYEGFGLPPLEALACGTPVVASDAASLPEVVGDAGVLLPAKDADGMAGALIQLARDEAFRTEMRRRALAQAARFSWRATARATLAAYQDARG